MRTDNLEFVWDGRQRFAIRQSGVPVESGRLELFSRHLDENGQRKLIDSFEIPQRRNWVRVFQLPEGTRALVLTSTDESNPVDINLSQTIATSNSGPRAARRVFVAEASTDAAGGSQRFELKALQKARLEVRLNQIVERYRQDARRRERIPFWWLTFEERESKTEASHEVEITPATGISGAAPLRLMCEYARPESRPRDGSGAPTAVARHAMRESPYAPILRLWAEDGAQIPESVRSGLLFFHVHNQLIDLEEARGAEAVQEIEVRIPHEVAAESLRISVEIVQALAPSGGIRRVYLEEALEDGTAKVINASLSRPSAVTMAKPPTSGWVIEYDFDIVCYGDHVGVVSGADVVICPAEDQARTARSVTYRVTGGRDVLADRDDDDPMVADLISDAAGRVWSPEAPLDFPDEGASPGAPSVAEIGSRWLASLHQDVARVLGDRASSRDLGLPDSVQGFDALGVVAYAQCLESAGEWPQAADEAAQSPTFITYAAFRNDPVVCAFLCENFEPGKAALKLGRSIPRWVDKHPAARILAFFGQKNLLPPGTDERNQLDSLKWLRRFDLLEKLRVSKVVIEDYSDNFTSLSVLDEFISPLLGSVDELRKLRDRYEQQGRTKSASLLGAYMAMRADGEACTLRQLIERTRQIRLTDQEYESSSKRLASIIERRISVPGQPRKAAKATTVDEARERLTNLIQKISANPFVDPILKEELAGIDVSALDLKGAADNYEILLNLESDQQALTFAEVVAVLERWTELPAFVRGLPGGAGPAADEDSDAKSRLSKWLENAQRGLPRQHSGALANAEAQVVARLTARIGKPGLRAFNDGVFQDLLALSRIFVFHRAFKAVSELSSRIARAEASHDGRPTRADNAKLRRLLCCWPSRAADAWTFAEELAKRAQDDSPSQLRSAVDLATLEFQ